ncbi:MAG TPA: SAM-dependent methyltransferase [Candidatus Saccharimonadales bacterium]|nr:SAM-dependent methyltransferase [Candidatus Saccharimonadales bacterium]
MPYVSRAGEKLAYALTEFRVVVTSLVCADFGSNTGGFVDCLLQNGARKVYAVETGYGVLDWNLRNDSRVVAMERSNAMHVALPEKVDLVSIDTSWTKLAKVVPNALQNLAPNGQIIALVKPHYEASPHQLRKGKLPEDHIPQILAQVRLDLEALGLRVHGIVESPIVGGKAKNKEYLCHVTL